MQRVVLLIVALVIGVVALATVGFYAYERPAYLRIAVTRGSDSQKLLVALNQQFIQNHANLRFRLILTADARSAAKAMEARTVDLAVVRSDIAMPTNGETALILSHQYAVIAAPPGKDYANIADLKGKHIAVVATEVSGDGNEKLLDTIEAQYSLPRDSLIKRPADVEQLPKLLAAGEVDAVLAFGRFDSPQLEEIVRILSHSVSPPQAPVFVPIVEADAIAKKSPGFEATEILRGAFGGTPSRPAENVTTIGATMRLVARDDLANSTVGDVTRLVLANRVAAATVTPVANHIEAPETDKGQVLPTHPGAAAFLDGEEQTFLDRYSDYIYIGAMIGSVLLSGVATLASRITVQGYARFDLLMEQALVILKAGREASDLPKLARLELEIDDILTRSLAAAHMPKLDGHQLAALTLAIQQARLAIADRRAEILGRSSSSLSRPSSSWPEA